jgi:hypothetical protein
MREFIKTLKEREVQRIDIQESELHATAQAAIDFLERQAFLDPRTQALLELREPPESTFLSFYIELMCRILVADLGRNQKHVSLFCF